MSYGSGVELFEGCADWQKAIALELRFLIGGQAKRHSRSLLVCSFEDVLFLFPNFLRCCDGILQFNRCLR